MKRVLRKGSITIGRVAQRLVRALRHLGCVALLLPALASAHAIDAAYVRIANGEDGLRATVDVPVRALDVELGLDRDGDGRLQWRELTGALPAIGALLAARLDGGAQACAFADPRAPELVELATGLQLRLAYTLRCPASAPVVDAHAWFERLPAQRVYLQLDDGASLVLTREVPRYAAPAGAARPSAWRRTASFFVDGVVHLLTGYDHVAFVFVLLLGVTLARRTPATPRAAVRSAAAVITAFTAAHSITLALAAYGAVRLPPAPVEVAIAATVLIAAVGTALRIRVLHAWPIAFLFGLVHGLGFASVLGDLLRGSTLAAPLFAFNLGIEAGQLAVAAAVIPLLLWIGRRPAGARVLAPLASAGVALLAAGWVWQRLG